MIPIIIILTISKNNRTEDHVFSRILYWLLNFSAPAVRSAKFIDLILESDRIQQVTRVKEQGIKKEDWFIGKRKPLPKKIN